MDASQQPVGAMPMAARPLATQVRLLREGKVALETEQGRLQTENAQLARQLAEQAARHAETAAAAAEADSYKALAHELRDQLKAQARELAEAHSRISDLEAAANESSVKMHERLDAERERGALVQEEASQMRDRAVIAEAGRREAEARLERLETERRIERADEQTQRRARDAEHERLEAELSSALGERRESEARWGVQVDEGSKLRVLIEAQRDEALERLAQVEAERDGVVHERDELQRMVDRLTRGGDLDEVTVHERVSMRVCTLYARLLLDMRGGRPYSVCVWCVCAL